MKTYSIIAAAAIAASFAVAGSAHAESGTASYDYPQATQAAAKSRADVKAETLAARAAGQIVSGEASVQQPATRGSYTAAPQRVAGSGLPLNVEAISFDGRSIAQTNSDAEVRLMARAAR